ncbi:LmeA family phospholipid-binding protein [Nucisporomicrobium flavum]|uniref:LmeA family phospholipid-binding protein n=1 Tax=Nucisporomicrobium flavum TaxID=2785915 RepID=UPI0018F77BEF|nr:DUF2993 domain-containing protein [Nucisporomicrobium flavum]
MTRRRWIAAAVAAAAVAVPLTADRVTEEVAEHRLAGRLPCLAGAEVELGGFPVLTQLASGRLDSVRVRADDVPLTKVTVRHLDASARDVRLGDDGARIGSVTADATVPYAALPGLGAAEGVRILGGDDAGRLVLEAQVPVRGITLPATVYADLALDGGRLTLTPAEVELSAFGVRLPAGRLPAGARKARSADLPPLPAGLAYRSIRATHDGLQVSVGGDDLDLTGAGAGGKTKSKSCGGTA